MTGFDVTGIHRIVGVLGLALDAITLLSGGWVCLWCGEVIADAPCDHCGGLRDGAVAFVYEPPQQLEDFQDEMRAVVESIVVEQGEP